MSIGLDIVNIVKEHSTKYVHQGFPRFQALSLAWLDYYERFKYKMESSCYDCDETHILDINEAREFINKHINHYTDIIKKK